jgi:kumamolisin
VKPPRAAIHDRKSAFGVVGELGPVGGILAGDACFSFEEVLREAAILGVTVCCSAGDYGSSSEFLDGHWVDYPASVVLARCGGTTLVSRGDTILLETVVEYRGAFFRATGEGARPSPFLIQRVGADDAAVVNRAEAGRGSGVANADPRPVTCSG